MENCFSFREMASEPVYTPRPLHEHSAQQRMNRGRQESLRVRTEPQDLNRCINLQGTLKQKISEHIKDEKQNSSAKQGRYSSRKIQYLQMNLSQFSMDKPEQFQIFGTRTERKGNNKGTNGTEINENRANNKQLLLDMLNGFMNRLVKIDDDSVTQNQINQLNCHFNQTKRESYNLQAILDNHIKLEDIISYTIDKNKQNQPITNYHNTQNYQFLKKKINKASKNSPPIYLKQPIKQEKCLQLTVRKIQKILCDGAGNQFIVTIQKVK